MEAVTKQEQSYALDRPQEIMELANVLAKYIKDNKLTSKIQGKDFVNVEGWQFAGAMLGLTAIPEDPECLTNDSEIKYKVTVRVVKVGTGEQVGAGYAICSNAERSKRNFDEYAVISMAQTRAIGKAYRNLLAWIIKAAGYETTPAEEMPETEPDSPATPRPQSKPKPAKIDEPPAGEYAGREGEYPLPEKLRPSADKQTLADLSETELTKLDKWLGNHPEYPELRAAVTNRGLPF